MDEADGLEIEFQCPDVATKRRVLGRRLVLRPGAFGKHGVTASSSTTSWRLNVSLASRQRIDVDHHAGGQFAIRLWTRLGFGRALGGRAQCEQEQWVQGPRGLRRLGGTFAAAGFLVAAGCFWLATWANEGAREAATAPQARSGQSAASRVVDAWKSFSVAWKCRP